MIKYIGDPEKVSIMSQDNQQDLETISMSKFPPFWKMDIVLWFGQLEAQFKLSKVTRDDTKFNDVVGLIES